MDSKNSSWGLMNFLAIIILAAILVIGGSLLGNFASKKQTDKSVAGLANQFKPVVVKTITYQGEDGKTAMDILKASHQVRTEDSTIGSFVTSIDGTENTLDTYWMFYVNDQLAPSGADQYNTKTGETVEWRFEKLQ
ncbi:MAG: hypothetical protein HW405_960 [Candidatus Berkelbacteria bacterium]|nr:hypothetical protein [Candidatus Berkelbacteria bacterium]